MRPSISAHLSVAEFVGTSHRDLLDEQARIWTGSPSLRISAERFAAEVFEPIRTLVGPLHVNSGYRCPALNSVVGGVVNSRHMLALAADVVPLNMTLRRAMEVIAGALLAGALPQVDKVIIEAGTWIHMQAALLGQSPRRLALATDDTQHFRQFV